MKIEPGRLALALALVIGCGLTLTEAQTPSSPPGPAARPAASPGSVLTGAVGETQTGLAAYYSRRLNGGRTASGERFDNGALTTAHQTLPFGTRVRVTNLKNKKSVVLRVNDRGPAQPNGGLDVSRAAAERLGFVRAGLTEVKVEVVAAAEPRPSRSPDDRLLLEHERLETRIDGHQGGNDTAPATPGDDEINGLVPSASRHLPAIELAFDQSKLPYEATSSTRSAHAADAPGAAGGEDHRGLRSARSRRRRRPSPGTPCSHRRIRAGAPEAWGSRRSTGSCRTTRTASSATWSRRSACRRRRTSRHLCRPCPGRSTGRSSRCPTSTGRSRGRSRHTRCRGAWGPCRTPPALVSARPSSAPPRGGMEYRPCTNVFGVRFGPAVWMPVSNHPTRNPVIRCERGAGADAPVPVEGIDLLRVRQLRRWRRRVGFQPRRQGRDAEGVLRLVGGEPAHEDADVLHLRAGEEPLRVPLLFRRALHEDPEHGEVGERDHGRHTRRLHPGDDGRSRVLDDLWIVATRTVASLATFPPYLRNNWRNPS